MGATRQPILLIPIRVGAEFRIGASVNQMKFTKKQR